MTLSVDLNSDLAEGFGRWRLGDDEAMLGLVSSANIACGFHAGDPRGMLDACRIAAARGVAIGAHLGYRDLAGFGRRALDVASDDLVPELIYQLGALTAIAAVAGTKVAYVKPHGALYTAIFHDERQALDVVEAISAVDPSLPLLGLPGSAAHAIAADEGIATFAEAFVDRAYRSDGTLVPRGECGAVLRDPALVAARAVRLVTDGTVETMDGSTIQLSVDSLCLHGDTDGAVEIATATREALRSAGVAITSFTAAR